MSNTYIKTHKCKIYALYTAIKRKCNDMYSDDFIGINLSPEFISNFSAFKDYMLEIGFKDDPKINYRKDMCVTRKDMTKDFERDNIIIVTKQWILARKKNV